MLRVAPRQGQRLQRASGSPRRWLAGSPWAGAAMSRRNKDKGRIPGQWTALRWEVLDSAAWKQMSMGARLLYIALIRPLSYYNDNNGRIFLSTRRAADELGAGQRAVCFWFRELAHYGFIVQADPGNAMRA